MPAEEPTADVEGEGTLFADYLSYFRDVVAEAVLDLGEEEQRTTRLASGWTPLELLSHLVHMERRWFVWGFLGEDVDQPWGDWDSPEPVQGSHWRVPVDVAAVALVARLREGGERTSRVLAEHDLDEVPAPSPQFDEGVPALRWICFHVLHEYARHAGHLDIAVELAGVPAVPHD